MVSSGRHKSTSRPHETAFENRVRQRGKLGQGHTIQEGNNEADVYLIVFFQLVSLQENEESRNEVPETDGLLSAVE